MSRLDVALVDRKIVDSREKAQRLIMAGKVKLNGRTASKSSQKVKTEDSLTLVEPEKYVSRGGYKMEAAFQGFKLSCEGEVCLDIGASTGGFTDCLLQHGAKLVYAVDVGKNQLDWRLSQNPAVKIMDETNARNLLPSQFNPPPSLVTMDASFISATKLLPSACQVSTPQARFVVLIKPQFEAGRDSVERGGVVRDPLIHTQVIESFQKFATQQCHLIWHGVVDSPLLGPAGNKEFLAFLSKSYPPTPLST